MKINQLFKKSAAAITFLGIGFALGTINKKIVPESFLNNVLNMYKDTGAIIAELDKDDLPDKIKQSFDENKMLVIVISDGIVPVSDYFEIHPLNFDTCKDFVNKIEEDLIIHIKLFPPSSGTVPILNGGNILKVNYRTLSEGLIAESLATATHHRT
jgi:hypothetical protein